MTEGSPTFARLDALLDQVLELREEERAAFLAGLSEAEREGLERLMQPRDGILLSELATRVNETLAGAGETDEGTHAGRWRLHKQLGSGGMGQVFYATRVEPGVVDPAEPDTSSGSEVVAAPSTVGEYQQRAAIKILWSQTADAEVKARFFRERRILASLDHPGLARFLDGGFLADGRPWFAMEYVDGEDVVTHAQTLTQRERIALFVEVCRTVSHAHERLIVHRDIKPQNVLVDSQGRSRLLDFGVATVLAEVDDGVVTRTQGSPLTLQYASPEQVSGNLVSVASDVYQLGLLLYEMLTGHPPRNLADMSLNEAIGVILNEDISGPGTSNAAVAADLDAITMMALSQDPDRRYPSVSAFSDDLQRFLADQPVMAVRQSHWYVTRRFIRRNAGIVSVSVALALGLSLATVVSLRLASEARAQAERSAAAQQILTDVFQNADPFGGSGANLSLAEALVRAQPAIEQRVAADPELAFEVQKNLAEIYSSLGLVEEEQRAFQAVVQVAPRLDERADYAHLLGIAGVGGTYARTNPQQAADYFAEHLPARPDGEDQVTLWLDAQYSYVGALNRLRQHGRADEETDAMTQVVQQYEVNEPRIRSRLSQLHAGVARRAGNQALEDQHWRDAVAYARDAGNPSALAVMLNNRAIQLGRMGRFTESEQRFLEAIAIFEDAEHRGPTLGNVLRSYAGLQFRDRRIADAIATSEQALELLDAKSQVYARFVAELNLALYLFADQAPSRALQVVVAGVSNARASFPDDSGVPDRMLRVFAKLLVFGSASDLAAHALHLEVDCNEQEVADVLERLEASEETSARAALWDGLAALSVAHPDRQMLDEFVKRYREEAPPFFDALDRWRVLERLRAYETGSGLSLPPDLIAAHGSLAALRSSFSEHVSAQRAVLASIADDYRGSGEVNSCRAGVVE